MEQEECVNPSLNSVLNLASNDKFLMVLQLPDVLKRYSKDDSKLDINHLQMSVHGSVVPAVSVPSIETRYASQASNWSSYSRPSYDPLSVNFILDNEFKNYYVLWKWLAVMNSPRTGVYGGTDHTPFSQTEYQTTISIVSLDEYNEPVIQFNYYNAFITSLGSINYSYRNSDYIESVAQFAFGQLDIKYEKNLPVFDK